MVTVKVSDTDRGFDRVMQELLEISGAVRIGIQGSDVIDPESEGYSLVQIAAVHEFGSRDGRIPQRSFLRSTFDEHLSKIDSNFRKALTGVANRKISLATAFALMGLDLELRVRRKILSKLDPPNTTQTVARKLAKGSYDFTSKRVQKLADKRGKQFNLAATKVVDTPLVDTGRLINSIRSVVEDRAVAKEGGEK